MDEDDSGDEDLWASAKEAFPDTFRDVEIKSEADRVTAEPRQEAMSTPAGQLGEEEMGEAQIERTPSLLSAAARPYPCEEPVRPMVGSLMPPRLVETTPAPTSSFALGPTPHRSLTASADPFGTASEAGMFLQRSQSLRPGMSCAGLNPWSTVSAFDTGANPANVYDGFLTHPPTVPSQPAGGMRMDGLMSPSSEREMWLAQARAQAQVQVQVQAQAQLGGGMGFAAGLDSDALGSHALNPTMRSSLVPPGMSPFAADGDMSPFLYESFGSTTGLPSGTRRSSATIAHYEDVKEERAD